MEELDCKGIDTRDAYGRDRYLPLTLESHVSLGVADDTWFFDVHPSYYHINKEAYTDLNFIIQLFLMIDLNELLNRDLIAVPILLSVSIKLHQNRCIFTNISFISCILMV